MILALARNWWSLVIRGFLGILIGILTFVWPGITLTALVFLFAGYAFVDGAVNLAGAMRAVASHERWGELLFEGIAGLAAGVVTVLWPAITALSLVYVIAVWAIVTGIAEIAVAVRLRRIIPGECITPKTSAYAPNQRAITNAPPSGTAAISTPKRMDAMPLSTRSHQLGSADADKNAVAGSLQEASHLNLSRAINVSA